MTGAAKDAAAAAAAAAENKRIIADYWKRHDAMKAAGVISDSGVGLGTFPSNAPKKEEAKPEAKAEKK